MYCLVMDNDDADEYAVFASRNVEEHHVDLEQSQIVRYVGQACVVLAWYEVCHHACMSSEYSTYHIVRKLT